MPVTEAERSCIVNLIGSINPSQFKGLTTKIKFLYPAIYGKIKKFQDRKNIKTFSEVLYLVINGMEDVPKCCGISDRCLGKLRFKSINDGYFNHCKMCSSLSEDFKLKRFETNIDRYGVRYPTQCKMVLEKTVLTNLKRYNVKNVKQIKKESEEKNETT